MILSNKNFENIDKGIIFNRLVASLWQYMNKNLEMLIKNTRMQPINIKIKFNKNDVSKFIW